MGKTEKEMTVASIWTMGEILAEIMRPGVGMALDQPGEFIGPFPSGAPAIFIDTVAKLGHPAGIIGGVGKDDFGHCILTRLIADGVDCRYVLSYPHGSTAVAFVTYFFDGSRKFLYHIDHTPAVLTGFTGDEQIEAPAFFHVMGCSLMVNDAFREQILHAKSTFLSKGARISFDPNIRTELLGEKSLEEVVRPVLENCSVLLPGITELALLSGAADIRTGALMMFDRYPIEIIVVKRGKQGCSVFSRDGQVVHTAAYPIEEVDPTGAGDCFDAGFLCGLLENRSIQDCSKMAAAAGALNAAAFGPMEGKITSANIEALLSKS